MVGEGSGVFVGGIGVFVGGGVFVGAVGLGGWVGGGVLVGGLAPPPVFLCVVFTGTMMIVRRGVGVAVLVGVTVGATVVGMFNASAQSLEPNSPLLNRAKFACSDLAISKSSGDTSLPIG